MGIMSTRIIGECRECVTGVNEALGIRADRAMAELVRVASVGPLV